MSLDPPDMPPAAESAESARSARSAEAALTPFHCDRCGATVAVVDADAATCAHCAALVAVPEAHRAALRALAREHDAIARANVAFRRYARFAIPGWLERATSLVPALVFWLGLAAFVVRASIAAGPSPHLARELGIAVWLPLELAIVVMVTAYGLGKPRRLVELLRTELRAGAGKDGGPPTCRRCGSPLVLPPGDVVVRCLYCHADSLVELGAGAEQALAASSGFAEASAERAIAAATAQAASMVRNARAMGLFTAIPIAMLCLWSLVAALREYFVVHVVLVFALMFLGMVTGAGLVGNGGPRAHANGALVAAGMFLAPMLFFAGAGTSLGWWDGPSFATGVGAFVFGLPALLFVGHALSLAKAGRSSP